MLYELRVYDVVPGRMKAIVDRFANATVALFKKHGIRPILFLEPVIAPGNQLIYLIEWESLAEREAKWDKFMADPEWIAARTESEKDGPILTRTDSSIYRGVPSIMSVVRG